MQLDGDVDANQQGKEETRTGTSVWERTTVLYVRRKILSTLFTLLGLYREGCATNCRHYADALALHGDRMVWFCLGKPSLARLCVSEVTC